MLALYIGLPVFLVHAVVLCLCAAAKHGDEVMHKAVTRRATDRDYERKVLS